MAKIIKQTHIIQDITCLHDDFPDEPVPLADIRQDHQGHVSKQDMEHACEEAFQLGYAQGLTEGAEQERQQTAEKVSILDSLMHSLPTAIDDHRLHLSHDIANIVLMIVQEFFVTQHYDNDAITQRILNILTHMKEHQTIEVILHPQDLALLQQDVFASYTHLRFTSSEHLRLGGCVIKSEHGVFDSSIERQIDNLKQALLDIRGGDSCPG